MPLRFGRREHTPQALAEILQFGNEVDEKIRQKGLAEAIFVLDEYFDSSYMPLVRGEDRDKLFTEKLRKIKWRYFDPI